MTRPFARLATYAGLLTAVFAGAYTLGSFVAA